MITLDRFDRLFVVTAFTLQILLIAYFSLRKWRFATAMKYGWVIYALGFPALVISLLLWRSGKPWQIWMGGLLLTGWGIYGFVVDVVRQIPWRSPPNYPVLVPYVLLYLSAQMFYWWPLGMLARPLWFVYAVLFLISTLLNITSHA